MARIPSVDLALPLSQAVLQIGQQFTTEQHPYRLHPPAIVDNRDCDRLLLHRLVQACDQVQWHQWRIAGQQRDQFGVGILQRRGHTGQWTLKVVQQVAKHRHAKLGVPCLVAIGVDRDAVDLRAQALQYMLDQRPASQRQQAFVLPSHAAGLTTSENDTGNFRLGCM